MVAANPSLSDWPEGLADRQADFFACLGLPRSHHLSRDQLEEAYFARAALVHPDRYVEADQGLRTRVLLASDHVNRAYRTLRDRALRAEYLVLLGGIDLNSNEREGGAPMPRQDFLLEMIERREAMPSDDAAREELIEELEDECDAALGRALAALDKQDVRMAAQVLIERRYLVRLRDEIAGENPDSHG